MSQRPLRIFIAGEGQTDIGNAADALAYQDPAFPGVVQTLLDKAGSEPWQFCGAIRWKDIRKFRAGHNKGADRHNVAALALKAREVGADAIAFVRDRDGHQQRGRDVDAGIAAIGDLPVVGGVAIETVEAWVLRALGDAHAEKHRQPRLVLARDHSIDSREDKVATLQNADFKALVDPKTSLGGWLCKAQGVLQVEQVG